MAQEQVKNTPLTGHELRNLALHLLRSRLHLHGVLTDSQSERVIDCFLKDMNNDYVFAGNFMYPQVELDLAFQLHVIEDRWAFTLTPVFLFTNPSHPRHEVFIHRPLTVPKPPLSFSLDDEHVVDCFRLKCKVDNPNLVRVHLDMPITITKTVLPNREEGRPFVSFETVEIKYDPKDYDPLPPPEYIDESSAYAAEWGLKGATVEFPAAEAKAWEEQEPMTGEVGHAGEPAPPPIVEVPSADFEQMMRARKRAALIGFGLENLSPEEREAAERAAGLQLPEPALTIGVDPGEESQSVTTIVDTTTGDMVHVSELGTFNETATEALMKATNDSSVRVAVDPDDAKPKKSASKAKKRSRS
jgi:hypothetical protein